MEGTDNNLNDNRIREKEYLLRAPMPCGRIQRASEGEKKWKMERGHSGERERITDSLIKNRSVHEYYIRRGTRPAVILAARTTRFDNSCRRNDFPDFSGPH